jgi:NAD(P)-dependent dehydrogenase (short-subunit alcohol dehydrogenase family)
MSGRPGAAPPVAIVTGASSGIGAACAGALAALGHRVYGTSRDPAFRPDAFRPLTMDVCSDPSVAAGVVAVLAAEGRIDVAVNSAGYGLAGAVEDTSLDEARRQLETNFFGSLRVCRAVLPAMRGRGSGLIVNVSSIGGVIGLPFQGLYSASKFALEGLSESLRQEVKPFGIRVVLVEPGDVATAITRNRVLAAAAADGSAYREPFARALRIIEKEEAAGVAPGSVAELVARLVQTGSPRPRYTVGHLSQRASAKAKALVPPRLFERLLMSFYGL